MFETYIQPLIIQHGYLAVFCVVMLESAGLPLPGETALILASAYAGATGHLNIAYVILSAIAGAVIGDNFGYLIGRFLGAKVFERYGGFVGLTEKRLLLGQYLFQRHGAKIVFFGRFIALLRVFAAVLAGLNKYAWRSFLIWNAAGAVAWALVMGMGGYFFGDAIDKVSGPLGLIGLGLVVGGLIVFALVMRREEKKWEDRLTAEALGDKGSGAADRDKRDANRS